jgi:hypothetical protein
MSEPKKTKSDAVDPADEASDAATKTPPAAIAPVAKTERKRGLYQPTRNWRCGFLFLEGQDYEMAGIPEDILADAVAQGHLLEV